MYAKGKYALLLLGAMVFSPLTSFLLSLRFYKSAVSQFFMIVFAFYFGSHIGLGWDLSHHYVDMREYYFNRSVSEILNNPLIYVAGPDYFHVALKIVLSRFHANPALFGGVMASIYAALFLNFFREFRSYYLKKMPVLCGLFLLCVVFIVQYYWYYGVRYYPGFFFFAGFYMRYVNTHKYRYILISFLCVLFHFALSILPIAVLANWLLKKIGSWSRILLLSTSLIYRTVAEDFVPLLIKYFPNLPFLRISVTNTNIRREVLDRMIDIRTSGNYFYLYRDTLILVFGFFILIYLWYKKADFRSKFTVLFGLFLTLFSFANFGYADLTFSDRVLKISLVFFYAFLFTVVYDNYHLFVAKRLTILILVLIPLLYSIVSQLVEQREYLFHLDLILGNFFTDWHGGLTDYRGGMYHKYMN